MRQGLLLKPCRYFSIVRMYWLVISILVILSPLAHASNRQVLGYTILPESRIAISGSTNVSRFACLSINESPAGSFILEETTPHGRSLRFRDADLTLSVSSFDCGHKVMNRDMHQAMGGKQFPYINIKIIEATNIHFNSETGCGTARVSVAITLNGKTRHSVMQIHYQSRNSNRFSFEASKKMRMSDFGVIPPSPALGLVRVNDEVTISLNLQVQTGMLGANSR